MVKRDGNKKKRNPPSLKSGRLYVAPKVKKTNKTSSVDTTIDDGGSGEQHHEDGTPTTTTLPQQQRAPRLISKKGKVKRKLRYYQRSEIPPINLTTFNKALKQRHLLLQSQGYFTHPTKKSKGGDDTTTTNEPSKFSLSANGLRLAFNAYVSFMDNLLKRAKEECMDEKKSTVTEVHLAKVVHALESKGIGPKWNMCFCVPSTTTTTTSAPNHSNENDGDDNDGSEESSVEY